MESLAPPHILLISVQKSIERGFSVRKGISSYLQNNQDDFSQLLVPWLQALDQGRNAQNILPTSLSLHRRHLLLLLTRGLQGESIYQHLQTLELELIEACRNEQSRYHARLPYLLMIPLLLFMFPAFLLLLFGPLLHEFLIQLGGQL